MSLRFRQIGRQVTFISFALAMLLMPFGGVAMSAGPKSDRPGIPEGAFIEGTATYRERIALPRHAVFEAVLEDVTLADAKATEVGRTVISNPPGPPIRFSIAFDPEKIDAGRIYAVRARILVDGKLWFTSTAINRVLTGGGNGRTVHIALNLVKRGAQDAPHGGATSGPSPTPVGAHGLRLPATFRGDLPCADCQAIRYHLDLWPDQVFHLRREWIGKNAKQDAIGKWRVDPSRSALILTGSGETLPQFEIKGADRLRQMDMKGAPMDSRLPYELLSDGRLTPAELSLKLGGELVYLADAARFTECLTGRSYPVAQEGDFVKMQKAYLDVVKEGGERLYVTFEGSIMDRPRMEGSGTERSVVVNRFIDSRPEQQCERPGGSASLTNTYWRIRSITGRPAEVMKGRREPHLLLRLVDERRTYAATVGCNQLVGSYTLTDDSIVFTGSATTLMACPAPLDTLEQQLIQALARTRRWQIQENTLELMDEAGSQVALLEAVYL